MHPACWREMDTDDAGDRAIKAGLGCTGPLVTPRVVYVEPQPAARAGCASQGGELEQMLSQFRSDALNMRDIVTVLYEARRALTRQQIVARLGDRDGGIDNALRRLPRLPFLSVAENEQGRLTYTIARGSA